MKAGEVIEIPTHPASWCVINYGWELYPWQWDCLEALEFDGSIIHLKTVNGAGKTSKIICGALLWHLASFPGSMAVYMSSSHRQVKGQLWPSMKRLLDRYHPAWKYVTGNEITVETPTGSRAVLYSTDDPGLAEGWQPQGYDEFEGQLLIALDEMKSIGQGIIDAISIRPRWKRMMNVSSPGFEKGQFFNNDHSEKERFRDYERRWFKTTAIPGYNIWKVGIHDCPHMCLDPVFMERVKREIAIKGRQHPVIKSSYFAEEMPSGGRQVFDMEAVDRAMSGMTKESDWGGNRAAVDLGGGGNETACGIRTGNVAWIDRISHEGNAVFLAEELCRWFKGLARYGITSQDIYADAGGLGRGVIQQIQAKGWQINFFNFGATAINKTEYGNARAEMYFELAERMTLDEIVIRRDEKLRTQFTWIEWMQYNDRQLLLIPKDQMPDSPDRADVMAMLYYRMPRPAQQSKTQARIDFLMSKTMQDQTFELVTADRGNQSEGIFY